VNLPRLLPAVLSMSVVYSCAASQDQSKPPEAPPAPAQAGPQAPPPPPTEPLQPSQPGPTPAPRVDVQADSTEASEDQAGGRYAQPPPDAPAEARPEQTAPPTGSPPMPAPAAPTPGRSDFALLAAVTELQHAELRLAADLSDCRRACRALASMARSATRICALEPPGSGDRCKSARQRVARARNRVRDACGECDHGR